MKPTVPSYNAFNLKSISFWVAFVITFIGILASVFVAFVISLGAAIDTTSELSPLKECLLIFGVTIVALLLGVVLITRKGVSIRNVGAGIVSSAVFFWTVALSLIAVRNIIQTELLCD